MGEPCPAPLRVAMRSPLPFCSVPDRPYKILLEQVGTLCPSPTPRLACPFYLFIYLSLLIIGHRKPCQQFTLGYVRQGATFTEKEIILFAPGSGSYPDRG